MITIFVTNDDGIDSLGLRVLVEALAEHADVYVVAPKEQQSAKSHSITFLREVSVEEREMKGAVAARALDGTPVDCVKWGLGMLDEEGIRPDFVFSGINMGYNTGLAAYYSGTIAAAREGAINDVRSIALSLGSHDAKFFDYLLGLLPRLMDMGQCNDAYSAIQVAVALAEAFGCGVNDLPLSMVLSWYEQKAVCILLTLLHLGIKNIKLGPTLPAFVSSNVLNVLVENYGIAPITTPEADLAELLEA